MRVHRNDELWWWALLRFAAFILLALHLGLSVWLVLLVLVPLELDG